MTELTRRQEIRWLAIVLVLAGIVFGIGMSRSGFEGKDERRYAQAAKEIAWGENLFVMHYLGELYPDKPPLFFWMQAASYRVFGGASPFAARAPLWITAMASVIFAFLCFRRIHGPRTALIATVALILMFRFFWSSRWARLDIPMCAFTFGAFWASARLIFMRPGERVNTWGWAMLAWIFGALVILAKGPGVIAWIGAIATYAAFRRDFAIIRRHHPLAGFALMTAIAAAWFIPAAILGGRAYWEPMLGTHVVERFASTVRHEKPFYYFIGKLFSDTMPVAILLPAALWWGWKNRRASSDGGRTLFHLCWLGFGLVFFSIPAGKRGQYILPLYPAVAGLVAQFIVASLEDSRLRRLLRGHLWVLIALAGCGAVGMLAFVRGTDDFPMPPPLAMRVMVGAMLAVLAAGAWRAMKLRQELRALGLIALGVAVIYASFFAVVFPPNRSDAAMRQAVAFIEREGPGAARLGLFKIEGAFTLYSTAPIPRILDERNEARAFLTDGANWLLTTRGDYEELVEKDGDPGWHMLREWEMGREPDEDVLLFTAPREL